MGRLISDEYLAQQREMHANNVYGHSGGKWDLLVAGIYRSVKASDVLDYGCGTGALGRNLRLMGIDVRDYDPAVANKDTMPHPADLVTCCDVLEHVEPQMLRSVVQHIRSLVRVALFVVISTRPAGKHLPDGGNAHLIVQDADWWEKILIDHRLKIKRSWNQVNGEWSALMVPV